jgi:hypothetical protein
VLLRGAAIRDDFLKPTAIGAADVHNNSCLARAGGEKR